MPAKMFFKMLEKGEELRYQEQNRWLFELCDVMGITNTMPEYKTILQKVYQKRIMGEDWKDPEKRVLEPDNKHAVAWMENVFKQASKVKGLPI